MGDTLERRIVYMPSGLDAVEVKRDLNYDAGGPDRLLMDVYSPSGLEPGAQLPAILFIHGGPISPDLVPKPKDWGVYVSYGQLAASSGLVGITFNHRYHSLTDLEQSAGDIQSAIQYIRKNAG